MPTIISRTASARTTTRKCSDVETSQFIMFSDNGALAFESFNPPVQFFAFLLLNFSEALPALLAEKAMTS